LEREREQLRLKELERLEIERKESLIELGFMVSEDQASLKLRLYEHKDEITVAAELVSTNQEVPTTLFPNRIQMSEADILKKIHELKSVWIDTIKSCWNDSKAIVPEVVTKISAPAVSVTRNHPTILTIESCLDAWKQSRIKQSAASYPNLVLNHEIAIQSNSFLADRTIDQSSDQSMLYDLGLHLVDPLSIYTLELSVEGISSSNFLLKFENVIKLNLNVNKLKFLSGIELLINLTHLSVADNKLESLQGLEYLINLKSLSADRNRISDLTPIIALPKLISLSLTSNLIEQLPDQLQLVKLQSLKLEQNKLSHLSASSFRHMNSLTYLSVERNSISSIDVQLFDGNCMPILQTLILSHNNLSSLPTFMHQPLLRSFWITGNKIENLNAWKSVDQAKIFLPMLEKLYLQDNQITCISKFILKYLPLLAELNLSFNQLANESQLAGLAESTALKVLHVHDNPISSPSIHPDQAYKDDWKSIALRLCPSLTKISDTIVDLEMRHHITRDNNNDGSSTSSTKASSFADYLQRRHRSCTRRASYPHRVQPAFPLLFVHLFDSLVAEQVGFRSEEMADRRQLHHPASTHKKSNSNQESYSDILTTRIHEEYWEEGYINLLHGQLVKIMGFDHLSYQPIYERDKSFRDDLKTDWILLEFDNRMKVYQSSIKRYVTSSEAKSDRKQLHSAIVIQSYWRGYRTRQRVKHILSSIRYNDDELDELLDGYDQRFLDDLSVLIADESKDDMSIVSNFQSGSTLVYGDHRRPRNTPTHAKASSSSSENPAAWSDQAHGNRPSSSQSNVTSVSSLSNASVQEQRRTLDFDNLDEVRSLVERYAIDKNGTQQVSDTGTYSQRMAEEWGINDPRVIASLAKRNKRYK
jgi:Leucine-rich repeat (LRR) protein